MLVVENFVEDGKNMSQFAKERRDVEEALCELFSQDDLIPRRE